MKYAFPLSDEQRNVVKLALAGASVAVNAGAGSGKTHTCRAIGKNMNDQVHDIQFSVKGSENAADAYAGFANVTTANFHKRGKALCGNAEVIVSKVTDIAKQMDAEQFDAIAALTTRFKQEAVNIYANALNPAQIAVKYGINDKFIEPALECLAKSDAIKGEIDLDDMLRMPVLLGRRNILQGLIILDEVQDYTPNAFAFLSQCLTTPESQVVMVGDPSRQALMAFAGADASLFDVMANHYGCTRMEMNENRRCSQAVVANAPFKGNMRALADAPMGEVGTRNLNDVLNDVEAGMYQDAAILSEANAPLIELGINLLTKGVPVQMRAERLCKQIIRHAYKFLDTRKYQVGTIADAMRKQSAENAENEYVEPEGRADVINCIEALETYCLAKQIVKTAFNVSFYKGRKKCTPVHPIQQALNQLLDSKQGITLLTGHTAKGLEWNTVFHLPGKMKACEQEWQQNQADCLQHVIATRAKLNFYKLSAETNE